MTSPTVATFPNPDSETTNDTTHHQLALRLVHWSTALLLLFAVASILLRDVVDDRALRNLLLDCHRNAGVLVLVLLVLRIIIRHTQDFLRAATLTVLEIRAAAAVHLGLYAAMLAVPVLGLFFSSAAGKTLKLFGVLPLPKLLDTNADLADSLSEWHENLAWFFIALIVVHVLAALWHHFIRRDNVLNAMLGKTINQNKTGSLEP